MTKNNLSSSKQHSILVGKLILLGISSKPCSEYSRAAYLLDVVNSG